MAELVCRGPCGASSSSSSCVFCNSVSVIWSVLFLSSFSDFFLLSIFYSSLRSTTFLFAVQLLVISALLHEGLRKCCCGVLDVMMIQVVVATGAAHSNQTVLVVMMMTKMQRDDVRSPFSSSSAVIIMSPNIVSSKKID